MAISIELAAVEVGAAVEWQSIRWHEAIGEPDTMSVDALAFMEGAAGITAPVVTAMSFPDNFLQAVVRRGIAGPILFSGLVRVHGGTKPAKGAIRWNLSATGWEFLAALRKVGVPDGTAYIVQEDADPDREPTAVFVDFAASKSPTPGAIQALFNTYWNFPVIDTETYVFDLLPDGASVEEMTFSGTDIDGVMNELVAAANAAGLWWIANDSPDPQSTTAPNLALHVCVITLPDEGDDGDDLLAGFPSVDSPIDIAPYDIDNDNPGVGSGAPFGLFGEPGDETASLSWSAERTSIMAIETSFTVDLSGRRDAAYVRGATGYSAVLQENPAVAGVHIMETLVEGGTGWVSSPGGIWGEDYVDAPAAISPDQRDAIGAAYIAQSASVQWQGTIRVVGYDGWHKGQALRVTDQDWGFAGRWFLIRSVDAVLRDPSGLATEYTLQVGDAMSPALGFELRQQRLREEREEIAPATRFIMYVGDLLLDAGQTAAITGQLANDAGKAMKVKGVPAEWFLKVDGTNLADPEDTGEAFYLSDLVTETDEAGQITATLHAGAGATLADAAAPFAKIAGTA